MTLERWLCLLLVVGLFGCGDDAEDGDHDHAVDEDAGLVKDAGGGGNGGSGASKDAGAMIGEVMESDLSLDVPLRGKGAQEIHATVWSGGASSGATVLAVHGLSESGAVYGPIAEAMIEDPVWQKRVRRVIALDMPAHGESDFPMVQGGPTFGELAIEDYVGIVIDAVRALRERDMAPSVAIGHSMGGLELQAAQEQLLADGSSLAELGIERVVLLSPVPAHGQPWMVPMSGDLSMFVKMDPDQGAYLELPVELFIAQSFGKLDGTLADDAPTPAQASAAGYAAREPMSVLLQLLEAPAMLPDGSTVMPVRPSARAGAFAPKNGTTLELASFSQDPLVMAADLMKLYAYLAGTGGTLYDAVEADNAVHNMFVSDPEAVLEALQWPDLAQDGK